MSGVFDSLLQALRWLGRRGTRGVAIALLSATLLPGLGDIFRPFLGEVVFALLTIAFVRLHAAAMQHHLRRPAVPLAACAWTVLAIPLLIGVLCQRLSIDALAPQVYLALMLQAIASPMMATPAIAMLLGLDATVVLIVMVASTALLPLTATLFSHLFLEPAFLSRLFAEQLPAAAAIHFTPGTLGLRLFLLLAGSAALGLVLRRTLGVRRIAALQTEFDGLNIILLFIFAAALMGSVMPNLIEQPFFVLALAAVVFIVFLSLQLLSTLLFWHAGRDVAMALGFMCSQRNMGMMLVATAGAVPEQVWLYCALAQLPIYLGPMLLAPAVRRFVHDPGRHSGATADEQHRN